MPHTEKPSKSTLSADIETATDPPPHVFQILLAWSFVLEIQTVSPGAALHVVLGTLASMTVPQEFSYTSVPPVLRAPTMTVSPELIRGPAYMGVFHGFTWLPQPALEQSTPVSQST